MSNVLASCPSSPCIRSATEVASSLALSERTTRPRPSSSPNWATAMFRSPVILGGGLRWSRRYWSRAVTPVTRLSSASRAARRGRGRARWRSHGQAVAGVSRTGSAGGELEQPAGLAAQVADGDAQVGVAARSGTPSQAAGLGQGNVDRPAVGQGRIQGRIEVPREGHGRLVQDGGLHADHGRDAAAQQCRGEALGQVQGGGPSRLAGVEDDQPQPVGADHADQLVGADGIGAALAVVEQQAGGPAGRVVAAVADEVQQVEGPAGRVGRAQRLLQRGQGHAGQGHEVVVCVAAARPGPPRCLAATYPPAPPTTRATTRPSTSGARPASRARVSGQRRHRWAAMTTLLRIPFNHYG